MRLASLDVACALFGGFTYSPELIFSRLSLNYWPISLVVKFIFLLWAINCPKDFFYTKVKKG